MDEIAKLQSRARDLEAVIEKREASERGMQTKMQALHQELSGNKSALETMTAAKWEVEETLRFTEVGGNANF